MKKTLVGLLISLLLISCSKNNGNNIDESSILPIGTSVKYEVIGGDKLIISYRDEQENSIYNDNIPTGWTYSFKTTKANQFIYLSVSDVTHDVIGRIYINGTIKKEAKGGSSVSLAYP